MKVEQIMTTKVETVLPTASLRTVARKMHELGVGAMPVVENGNLLGIITDRDVGVHAIAMGHDPQSTEVQKVMTKEVYSCNVSEKVTDAAKMMEQHKIRRLTVMSDDETLVGILSVDDIAQCSSELAGAVLEAATPIH